MNPLYFRANQRPDLSEWLIHLVRPNPYANPALPTSLDVLSSIVNEGYIRASQRKEIVELDPAGAVCFYDVPLSVWPTLAATNPNGRTPHGIAITKKEFWRLGGRPAIYTDRSRDPAWPERERYRIVHTDLLRETPIDWMHEREWRFHGSLSIRQPNPIFWLCVDTVDSAVAFFQRYPGDFHLYIVGHGLVTRGQVGA